jgi:porin
MIIRSILPRRNLRLQTGLAMVSVAATPLLHAQDAANDLAGPNSVSAQLAADAKDKPEFLGVDLQNGFDAWKAGVKERTGLDFGVDYISLGLAATDSLGDSTAASGVFRVYGNWELFNRGEENNGSLVFKFENRHAYTDVAPADFAGELGYAGITSTGYSDQGFRATHLFWKQRFGDGRGVSYIGFLDTTDYVDVYTLASQWTAFTNIAFQTGSGAMGGIPDGALGAMVGGFLTKHLYLLGGIADANGDATNLGDGFDSMFNDFETFKSLEFGWVSKQEEAFLNNAHVTLWQVDERSRAGTPDGWGISASITKSTDNGFMPFLRGGWADDGGSLYEASVSTGFGYTPNPGQSMLGVGLNWNRPSRSTFGANLGDQYSLEIFQQLQLTEGIELTPSVQIIRNPALNPTDDWSAFFGLRLRVAL